MGSNSKDSGIYPVPLCQAYAKLGRDVWIRQARSEWEELPKDQETLPEAEWIAPPAITAPGQASKKETREQEDCLVVEGMRIPTHAVALGPGLRKVGQSVSRAFPCFCARHQEALNVGTHFGTKGCEGPADELAAEGEGSLRHCLGAPEEPQKRDDWGGASPIKAVPLQQWLRLAGDPETSLKDWCQKGVPLGIEGEVPTNSSFPAIVDNDQPLDVPCGSEIGATGAANYTSIYDNWEGAKIELDRYVAAGYGRVVPGQAGIEQCGDGSISRRAIVLETKEEGSVKRGTIVDLRRSGANSRSVAPQRMVLPRVCEVINDAQNLGETESLAWQQTIDAGEVTDGWGAELATCDCSDACVHSGGRPEELKHCVAPAYQEDEFPVMVMLGLGLKTAPLLGGTMAAALSRVLQGFTPDHSAQGQTNLDGPIWLSLGGRESRIRTPPCYLLTLRALGTRAAWRKGGPRHGSELDRGETGPAVGAEEAAGLHPGQEADGAHGGDQKPHRQGHAELQCPPAHSPTGKRGGEHPVRRTHQLWRKGGPGPQGEEGGA